jgi:type II secretory pathway pseudopilin PulG
MKLALAIAVLLPLLAMSRAFADDNGTADQQERDFEQKQRIYGNKHPWENTNPYGTQYTPPQSGAGNADSPPADEPKDKPAPEKSAKSAKNSSGNKASGTGKAKPKSAKSVKSAKSAKPESKSAKKPTGK